MRYTKEIKFWQGTNFWIALVLAIGGLFIGFPENEARNIVSGIFALVAGVGLFREKLKGLVPVDWKTWIRQPNTWNYIGAAVVAVVPTIPLELFTHIRTTIDAAIGGNWQGIATGVFSIATMLYYIFKGNAATKAA